MRSSDGPPPASTRPEASGPEIITVSDETHVQRLLPLMRAYCDFYDVNPSDAALVAMSRALIADPEHEGMQLLASDRGVDVGFATLFWSWQTLIAGRVGVMNDLYVDASARRHGVGSALIAACVRHCRDHGALHLTWQTSNENIRAQAVYDRMGATRETWVDYWLDTTQGAGADAAPAPA